MRWSLLAGSGLACAASALVAVFGDADSWPAGWVALASQALLIAALIQMVCRQPMRWASAAIVLLASWAALFTLPAAVYLARPELLVHATVGSAVPGIALVNLALVALALGLLVGVVDGPATDGPVLRSRRFEIREWVLGAWFCAGLAGLALLFALRGGPVHYLSNLDKLGTINAGLLPVVWLAQCTRYAVTAGVLARWAQGKSVSTGLIAFLVLGVGLAALIGARAFVAVAAVQLLLGYALLRGRPSLRLVLPVALITALGLVFVGGAVKRYSNYEAANPSTAVGLGEYLVSIAPDEAVDAYATNYADGVRYIALAIETVPDYADFEGIAAYTDLATRVMPRSIRPDVGRQAAIEATFLPGAGASPAIPLLAITYLGGGAASVVLAFALLGLGVATLDRFFVRRGEVPFPVLMAALALAVQLPILIRSGIPAGVVFLALDVIAMYVVARTSLRPRGAAAGACRRVLAPS